MVVVTNLGELSPMLKKKKNKEPVKDWPNCCKLKSNISEKVIAACVASARRILSPLRHII